MKYFILLFLAFLLYSCSDDSNPSNNSYTEKDSLIFALDSISIWSNSSDTQSTGGYWTDTTIKRIKVYFTGDCDYDSTALEAQIKVDGGVVKDYKKVGTAQINVSHYLELNITPAVYTSASFFIYKFGLGTPDIRHVTMKFIKVFKSS